MSPLEVARAFIDAVQAKQADTAADLCADDIEVLLPGADGPLRGRDGVRQMVRMAPQLEQSFRSEEERDGEARVTTLTRAPGIFANYTTWVFAFEDGRVKRLSFELRAAN
ncbi:MAG: nuclear transport factor 2 family protein [Chloroflexota bacterium]|nr:nuclear transport factor 2 family protein [Chloroflexota bacterium]MDE3193906.1 nuclear transport factor 2 family protein [Chloroflexota bacterium]